MTKFERIAMHVQAISDLTTRELEPSVEVMNEIRAECDIIQSELSSEDGQ